LDAPEEDTGLSPIEAPRIPEEVPDLPLPPEGTEIIGENLDRNTVGQYVRRSGAGWVRDIDAMRRGAQAFETRKWDQHPAWDNQAQNRTLFGGKVKQEDVRFIVLHSTASETPASTINERKAHFVVDKDGTITYLVPVPVSKEVDGKYKIPPHAGRSAWGGVSDLNEHSIGIEVVAPDGQDWTDEQYAAMKQLVGWLGGYYGLKQRDVVMHKQIAYSRYGRGRKSDPYGNPETMYARLGLPDNSDILDLEVARGAVASNIGPIRGKEYGHRYGAWTGLDAALYVQTKGTTAAPTRPPRVPAEIARWKQEIREKATIVSYTVKAGDTLYGLARQHKTHVEIIMAYNDLPNSTLSIGQILQIPVPKEAEPAASGSLDNPLMDSQMTREQALQNLTTTCPQAIRENQALMSVKYYGFDGKVHQGQLVVDKRLQSDIQKVFQVILETKFPVASVVPIADPRFNWSDDVSMAANNTSSFNYRNVPDTTSLSKHASGFAIDLNPKFNPYINRAGVVRPAGATYNTSVPGTLTAEHPVVKKFKELGWGWGGDWSSSKDYQHFEKVPSA
jgi:LysM repeat protein